MNEELIKKSDAIEAIELVDWYHQNRNKDIVSGANSREHQAWYKAEDIYKALEAVPAVKPKRGKWIDKGWRGDWQFETDGRGNCWYEYKCSECGYIKRGGKSNFCPNCGADMEKERTSK